jgi:hypothetical protein
MTKYEVEDGWTGYTPATDFVEAYENIDKLIYEIKNCIRISSISELKKSLTNAVESMQCALDEMNEDDELVEVEE